MMEMEEERLRMREHVMKNVSLLRFWSCSLLCWWLMQLPSLCRQVDVNKDRLVSLEEFLKFTERKEFNNPKEWEVKTLRRAGGRAGKVRVVMFPSSAVRRVGV